MNAQGIKNNLLRNIIFALSVVLTSVFFFSISVYSQVITNNTGTIVGKVKSIDTYEALIGVNVYLENTTYGAGTDSKGDYSINNIPPGSYKLIATYIGYKNFYKNITIEPDQVLHIYIDMEISALMTDEIVVTATRTPKRIKEVPVRTEIITQVEIKKKEAKTIYEALDALPGIRVEQQCSNCNFSMLRMEGLEGGYSQVLTDGQPSFTGLAGVYGLQQMQTGNIEQIEVVKGSGSALYGSDAIGGVVNVITKEPSVLPQYSFGINIGTHGTNSFYINGSQRLHRFGIMFSAQRDLAGGIDRTGGETYPFNDTGKDNYTDRVESENMGAHLKVYLFDPWGENSRFSFYGRATDEFRRGGNFITWDDPYDPDSEQIRTTRYETGFGMKKEFANKQKINFNYTFVNHYRNATNGAAWDKSIEAEIVDDELNLTKDGQNYMNTYGFSKFRDDWYPKPFIVKELIHIADARYSQHIGATDHQLLSGIQFRRSDLDQDINGDKSDKFANDLGMYLQTDLIFKENLEMITGIRYDIHKSEDHLTGASYDSKVFNPRFALRWNPHNDLALRANVGTGYRVPYLFSEDLHLCASAPRIYKGADLDPERATSMSLGADIYKIDYRLGLSVFYTTIKDKIEFISPGEGEVPSGYDYRWVNLGESYTQGFDVTFAGMSFNTRLQYSVDLTYTNAKFKEPRYIKEDYPTSDTNDGWKYSDYIPRSPIWSGNASITLNLQGGFQIYAHTKYTGNMYIDHVPEEDEDKLIIEKTDPYFIVNGKISKKILHGFNMFIGAKNLLDYTQPTRDNSDAAYMYAPLYGRLFYGGFEILIN